LVQRRELGLLHVELGPVSSPYYVLQRAYQEVFYEPAFRALLEPGWMEWAD
jgi:hypothetical protein